MTAIKLPRPAIDLTLNSLANCYIFYSCLRISHAGWSRILFNPAQSSHTAQLHLLIGDQFPLIDKVTDDLGIASAWPQS